MGTLTIPDYERSPDPVVDAINKYANHQSLKNIRDVYETHDEFEFSKVDSTQVFSEICRLNISRMISGDIPVDMLKLPANHCYKGIPHLIDNGIQSSTFPFSL